MSQIKIKRDPLDETERALEQYRELLAQLEAEGTIKPNTNETYCRYADMFVRWIKGEFEPGARNKIS